MRRGLHPVLDVWRLHPQESQVYPHLAFGECRGGSTVVKSCNGRDFATAERLRACDGFMRINNPQAPLAPRPMPNAERIRHIGRAEGDSVLTPTVRAPRECTSPRLSTRQGAALFTRCHVPNQSLSPHHLASLPNHASTKSLEYPLPTDDLHERRSADVDHARS